MSNETACVTRRTKGDGTIFQNKKGMWIARYKRKGFPPSQQGLSLPVGWDIFFSRFR